MNLKRGIVCGILVIVFFIYTPVSAYTIDHSGTVTVTGSVLLPAVNTNTMMSMSSASPLPVTLPVNELPPATVASTVPKTAVGTTSLAIYGDQQVTNRILSLDQLSQQITSEKAVPQTRKTSLQQQIAALTNSLRALEDKIDHDSSLDVLQADVNSVSSMYHIYSLVIPRDNIYLAGDKILTISSRLSNLGSKFTVRIATQKKNQGTLKLTLAQMNTELTDATKQATIAESIVASLVPGSTSAASNSNKTALTTALAHIALRNQDLVIARQDAKNILIALTGTS